MLVPMLDNFRRFQTGADPFGRIWDVEFRWLQTGISIRHADTVDVKFHVWTTDEPKQERVIALKHPDLLKLSAKAHRPLSDSWCLKMAALHLKHLIESGEDMERTLVTVPYQELENYDGELQGAAVSK